MRHQNAYTFRPRVLSRLSEERSAVHRCTCHTRAIVSHHSCQVLFVNPHVAIRAVLPSCLLAKRTLVGKSCDPNVESGRNMHAGTSHGLDSFHTRQEVVCDEKRSALRRTKHDTSPTHFIFARAHRPFPHSQPFMDPFSRRLQKCG